MTFATSVQAFDYIKFNNADMMVKYAPAAQQPSSADELTFISQGLKMTLRSGIEVGFELYCLEGQSDHYYEYRYATADLSINDMDLKCERVTHTYLPAKGRRRPHIADTASAWVIAKKVVEDHINSPLLMANLVDPMKVDNDVKIICTSNPLLTFEEEMILNPFQHGYTHILKSGDWQAQMQCNTMRSILEKIGLQRDMIVLETILWAHENITAPTTVSASEDVDYAFIRFESETDSFKMSIMR